MDAVRVEALCKYYKEHKAVDHISFQVGEGELFAFLGENGVGKSTTINMLSTVLEKTSGKAEVFGHELGKEDAAIRALLHHPRLLFLDEPATGLDPMSRRIVWDYIDYLRREEKLTIFLTTHYMEETADADHYTIVLHCLLLYAVVMGAGYLFHWYSNWTYFLITSIAYVIIYALVWIITSLVLN